MGQSTSKVSDIGNVEETVEALKTLQRKLHVLTPREHLPFLRRLNVLQFKLQRARSYFSLHSFRAAQYYILSTWHDLRAMRAVLRAAADTLRANVVCE